MGLRRGWVWAGIHLLIACQQASLAPRAPSAEGDGQGHESHEGAADVHSAAEVSLATQIDSTERAALDTPRILTLHEAGDGPTLEAALAEHRRVVGAAAARCESDDDLEEGSAAQMACEKLLLARAYIPQPADSDFTQSWMEHLEGMAGVLQDLARDADPASSARARCLSARLLLFLASWETERFLRAAATYAGPATARLDAVDRRLDELEAKAALSPPDQEELRSLEEELDGSGGDPDEDIPFPGTAPVTIDDLRISVSLVRGSIERAALVRSLGPIELFDARWLTDPEVAWDAHRPFLEQAEARLDEDTIGRSDIEWTLEVCE
ncbi:MAG: hypothetical protein CMN30_07280 [Sandaracinus sp.]|nr:hypothetical protein [Sandaracinus sp.]|tara:strand:+ start:4038 stop:5012 length:975 start_codon:yes stop_codon:yes gene_type:complete